MVAELPIISPGLRRGLNNQTEAVLIIRRGLEKDKPEDNSTIKRPKEAEVSFSQELNLDLFFFFY